MHRGKRVAYMTPPKMVNTGPCLSGHTLWVWKMAKEPTTICRICSGVMVTEAKALTFWMEDFLPLLAEAVLLFDAGASAAAGVLLLFTWEGARGLPSCFVASLGIMPVMA